MLTKKLMYGLTTAALVLGTACGPAEFLNPLFEESERIILPGLAGRWIDEEAEKPLEDTLSFEEKENQSYRFRIGGEEQVYEGFAGMIGSDCYFEVLPEKGIRNNGRFKIVLPAGEEATGMASPIVPIADGLCLVFGNRSFALSQEEEVTFQVLPTRMILKLKFTAGALDIWFLEAKGLKDKLDKGEIYLAHSKEPGFVVSASTRELRDFLQKLDQDAVSSLFTKMGTYRRDPQER